MGRFYKTASPQMVDFMYKIPEQAILKAIEGTDKQIDTEYLYKTETEKLLQKKALSPDEARQKEKLAGYQKEIDEVSQLLSTSPLAALKDKQRIRDLQSKIYQDVTRGEIAAQYKNYDIRQKHLEEETKKATNKDGTIRQEDLDAAMKAFDDAFARGEVDEQGVVKRPGGTAYDLKTGAYRTYSPEKLVNFYDKKEEFEKIAKDWKPSTDTDITQEFIDGNYYVTTRNKDKVLPLKELTFGIYKTMMYDTKAMEYYKQQARIRSGGNKELYNQEMTRLFGERVDPNNPFSSFKMKEVKDAEGNVVKQKVQKYDKEGKPEMKDGKPVTEEVPVMEMANPGELFMAAQAAADKQDINEIVRSRTLDATEAYTTALQQQKEIAVAIAKDNLENPITTIDIKNNQIVSQRLPGQNYVDIKTNLQTSKEGLKVIKDQLKQSYLETLRTSINVLGANATQQRDTKAQIDKFIADENYTGLEQFLQRKGIELPNVSQAARIINSTQIAIGNNERILKAQEEKIINSKEYQEYKRKTEKEIGTGDPLLDKLVRAKLEGFISEKFKNDVSQGVTTVQGTEWKQKGIINEKEHKELDKGFNYIKKNPLEIITSLGQATNAIINKVGSDGKVKQTFTNINELLGDYGIPLAQTPQKNIEGGIEELIYTIPGSKDQLAIKINRASVIDGNMGSTKVQTSKGTSESVNLGLLPLNINMEVLKIKDGKKIPENINIITSRDNFQVSNINSVINSNSNIGAVSHVQSQVSKADGAYEGLGTGTSNYIQDDYGVMYYPNEASGTSKGKVVVPNSVGGFTEAYGDQGIQLWQNYVKQK